MNERPHLTHGLERARLLLRDNRLAELTFDDLTAGERVVVVDALHAKLFRAHARVFRAHVVGVLVTVGFATGVGLAFFAGPLAHIGPTGHVRMSDPTLEAQVWLVTITLAALGIAAADYLIRRRHRLTRHLEKESQAIAAAIARSR